MINPFWIKCKEYINNYEINHRILKSFGFYDSSWIQDLCPSYTKMSTNELREINIYFANSDFDDEKNDNFTHHSISFQSHHDEDTNIQYDFECLFVTHDLNEIFSILRSNQTLLNTWLNIPKKQLEKKYIKRAVEHIKSTLDVYDYKDDFNDDLSKLIKKVAKHIKKRGNK